ncbi:MAG: ABC transporter substrate-binding protein [Lautropia sp.]|nr:ABC transporter substrate-binding protein [Lautropia sp.]
MPFPAGSIRRRFVVDLTVAALLAAGTALPSVAAAQAPRQSAVSVVTIVDHPSLDALRDGLHDELNAAGYQDGKNLKWTFQSAQGNVATAAQIARKFVGDRPDVIVPITTPAAQAVASATRDIPLVYNAITDPVGAQLVKSLEPSGTNITGVSDRLDADRQVELIRKVVPDVKTVGIVYSPAEANSVTAVRDMKAALEKQGIALVEVAAPRSIDVGQAAKRLVGKVDVIYSGNDNNVISAYESLIKVGNDAKIPLIAADRSSVQRGATAALAIDYYAMGRQTGRMVLRILKGEKPGDIASETTDKLELTLNLEAAQRQGVALSEQLQAEAKEVFGKPASQAK